MALFFIRSWYDPNSIMKERIQARQDLVPNFMIARTAANFKESTQVKEVVQGQAGRKEAKGEVYRKQGDGG